MDTSARHSSGGGGLSPNIGSTATSANNNSNNTARFRASVDAARSLYSNNGHQSLQPGSTLSGHAGAGNANNGGQAGAGASPMPGSGSKRPSSEMLASFAAGNMNTESA